MDQPLISVIIPTFKGAGSILAAVQSVATQTYQKIEIIVVVDGSNDGTRELLETHKKIEPRLRVINQKNRGASAARNTGFYHSRGTMIAFLDGDDSWHPQKLERQMAFLAAHADKEVVICTTNLVEVHPKTHSKVIKDFGHNLTHERAFEIGAPPHTTWLTSRATYQTVLEDNGTRKKQLYDEKIWAGEDADLRIRLIKAGATFINLTEPLTTYNLPLEDKKYKNQELSVARSLIKHYQWYQSLGSEIFDKHITWYRDHMPAALFASTLAKIKNPDTDPIRKLGSGRPASALRGFKS